MSTPRPIRLELLKTVLFHGPVCSSHNHPVTEFRPLSRSLSLILRFQFTFPEYGYSMEKQIKSPVNVIRKQEQRDGERGVSSLLPLSYQHRQRSFQMAFG